jgi:hypothetical protein
MIATVAVSAGYPVLCVIWIGLPKHLAEDRNTHWDDVPRVVRQPPTFHFFRLPVCDLEDGQWKKA